MLAAAVRPVARVVVKARFVVLFKCPPDHSPVPCLSHGWMLTRIFCLCACSAEKKVAAMSAGVVSSVAAAMASPLVAQATVTPSLQNFISSLVAGGTVLLAIAGAVTLVSVSF